MDWLSFLNNLENTTIGRAIWSKWALFGALFVTFFLIVVFINAAPVTQWGSSASMEPFEAAGGVVALAYAGCIMFIYGFYKYRDYRLVCDTPTAKVRSASMGRVELKGKAKPAANNGLVQSPITKTDCIGYHVKIQRWDEEDDNWETFHHDRHEPTFFLDDGTAKAAVDASEGQWAFDDDYEEETRENELSDELKSMVKKNDTLNGGMFDIDLMGGDDYRFVETRINPDDDLYILGAAKPPKQNSDECEIAVKRDERLGVYYISDKEEESLQSSMFWISVGALTFGSIGTPLAIYLFAITTKAV